MDPVQPVLDLLAKFWMIVDGCEMDKTMKRECMSCGSPIILTFLMVNRRGVCDFGEEMHGILGKVGRP